MSAISAFDATQNFDIITLLTASLVFVVSLSWNSLIEKTIQEAFPQNNKSLAVQTLYTISLTLFVGIFSNYVFKYHDQISAITKKIFYIQ